jgi:hypothetical protein
MLIFISVSVIVESMVGSLQLGQFGQEVVEFDLDIDDVRLVGFAFDDGACLRCEVMIDR